MFCAQCGHEIGSNQNFCSKCGSKIRPTPNITVNTVFSPVNGHIPQKTKKKPKRKFAGAGVAVSIVLVLCTIYAIFSNAVPKRVDYDLRFDRSEIQKFMDTVCKNVDAEYAQVGKTGLDGSGIGYGDYISATVTVKPYGMVAEDFVVRFYNSGDSDKVSSIVVFYYDHDSENEMACKNAIVEALEISFCGVSKGTEYTSQLPTIAEDISPSDDTQIVASYSLTNEAYVSISCYRYFAYEWTGRYSIYKTGG